MDLIRVGSDLPSRWAMRVAMASDKGPVRQAHKARPVSDLSDTPIDAGMPYICNECGEPLDEQGRHLTNAEYEAPVDFDQDDDPKTDTVEGI